jgi:hypothetical protein
VVKLGIAVLFVLLATTSALGASPQAPSKLAEGVLVLDSGRTLGYPRVHGAMLVTRGGLARRIVSRRWAPRSFNRRGSFVAVRAGRKTSALWMISRTAIRIPGSESASCIAWSADGALLSYVTGRWTPYDPDLGAGAYDGKLWVVPASTPRKPIVASEGLFPSTECPAWSKQSPSLAYVSSSESAKPRWVLRVYRAGSPVATLERRVPSISYRTFDWAPDRDVLVFADGASLYKWHSGQTSRLGAEGSLRPLEKTQRPDAKLFHALRFSPNGRYVAVSEGGQTGVFRADGQPVRILPGLLNGWAGNTGVLTLAPNRQAVIELTLYPLHGLKRRITKYFKTTIATDPLGRWFAYAPSRPRFTVVFRRPNGNLIRTVKVGFIPIVAAGVGARTGLAETISAY